jgi:hypothetical protein
MAADPGQHLLRQFNLHITMLQEVKTQASVNAQDHEKLAYGRAETIWCFRASKSVLSQPRPPDAAN